MNLDLSKIKKVFFVGIGGIGISAIARMMLLEKREVLGSDISESEITKELQQLGAKITLGQGIDLIPKDVDLIVYTIAIEKYDSKFFEKLKDFSVPIFSYPQMLNIITAGKYTIAISGTHGKTTTVAMIAEILLDAQKDPSVIIGSLLKEYKSNFIAGKSDLFVVEACEYRRSFLNINPKILVITNIDADHLDYYKNIEDIKNAFHELAMKVPVDGFIVCNPNDENIADVIKKVNAKIVNYQDFFNKDLKLKIPGIHNKKDAACALAVSDILKINLNKAKNSLEQFPGTWRRFEYKGDISSGAKIYDDYAHHPTEISSTLEAFREIYSKRGGWKITVVFQPHLFSRTKLLLNDFAKSFGDADRVLILPIYYAREENDGTISSQILSDEINRHEKLSKATAFDSFEAVEKEIQNMALTDKDIIVTMGAGEAFKIAEKMIKTY
jgi:UDP-N-acetylmuramate--alanine ligase